MSPNENENEQREYAWNYFKLHAGQRMMTFNFFVVVAALLTKGLADCISQEDAKSFMGLPLATALIVVTFASWKLDQRVRYLIKHAEAALKKSEDDWGPFALFALEETNTASIKAHWWKPQTWHMSYSKCFGVFYWVFIIIGGVGFAYCIL